MCHVVDKRRSFTEWWLLRLSAKFFPIYGYRLKYFHWVYLKFSSRLTFLLQLTAKFLVVLQPTVTPLKPLGNTSPFFLLVLHHLNRRASKYHRVKEEDLVARLSAHLFLQLHVKQRASYHSNGNIKDSYVLKWFLAYLSASVTKENRVWEPQSLTQILSYNWRLKPIGHWRSGYETWKLPQPKFIDSP